MPGHKSDIRESLIPQEDDPVEIVLLKEWLNFWISDDSSAAKPPNALHTRTIAVLVERFFEKNPVK